MAKKKKAPPEGASQAYLISFGDTMTALLAFFIVLNSLAEEQTGANLHAGTGSFLQTGDSMGVPGLFAVGTSANPTQMEDSSPIYIVAGDETELNSKGTGPDDEGDARLIRDREEDNFHRFLLEMQRLHKGRQDQQVSGEIAFDQMDALPHEGDLLNDSLREQLVGFLPSLRRDDYELEIRIWATTPAPSAWARAARQAGQIRQEILELLKLNGRDAAKVSASASPWHSRTLKRPAISFLIRRLTDAKS